MTPVVLRAAIAAIALLAACAVAAQELYRWVDEKGRTHITDTPPPSGATNVQKKTAGGSGSGSDGGQGGQVPFELALAMKNFPVVLYSAPACTQACSDARDLLNKRGVPFREVMVWDQDTGAELTSLIGSVFIPTLLVGKTPQKGFFADNWNALLDSARYPKAGAVPARAQAAPPLPKEYVEALKEAAKAEPVTPEAEQPRGPYSPGAPRSTPAKK